jgi:hypothetical protein
MKLKFFNLSNLFIFITILIAWYVTASVISPYLHYSFQQIGFFTGAEFLKSFSSYPGGIADYLATYLSQFFAFNSAGSLLIVAVASVQGLLTLSVLKSLAGELKFRYTAFTVILLFGVLVLCDYRYPYYASIRLLLAYIFTWGFYRLNFRWPRLSVLIWPLLGCLLFYLASGSALYVFALATISIFVVTNKERIWLFATPLFLILAALIPYIGHKFIFQMTYRNIYGITMVRPPEQLTYTQGFPIYIYYSLLPVILFVVLIFVMFSKPNKDKELGSKPEIEPNTLTKISFFRRTSFLVVLQVIVFGISGYFLFGKLHDSFKKKLITIEYLAENEQWADVIRFSESINKYDFRVNFQVNRAHAHLGDLGDRLFSYPQLLGISGLFIDPTNMVGSSYLPTSDLYFDLGFMGESQRYAFEAETLLPNSPRILKRLVMINLVKRNYDLAQHFLKVLDQNMLCRDWVSKYEKYVSDTTLAANDRIIAEKRRFSPKRELFSVGTLQGLKLLLETNRDNRMAYDYLLTFFILDTQLPEFVDYLRYYSYYNLKKLPKSWEEALAIYVMRNKAFPEFIPQETVSENCLKQITSFTKIIKSYKNDLSAAKSTLLGEYGETYWYYWFYLSPKVTNVLKSKTDVR